MPELIIYVIAIIVACAAVYYLAAGLPQPWIRQRAAWRLSSSSFGWGGYCTCGNAMPRGDLLTFMGVVALALLFAELSVRREATTRWAVLAIIHLIATAMLIWLAYGP